MKNISIDGGKTFCKVEEAIEFLTFDDDIDLDTLGYYMNDKNAFDQLMKEWETVDFSINQLITRYLEIAESDLIIK